jgi:hypothetical protein
MNANNTKKGTRLAVIQWRGQRFGMFVPAYFSDFQANVVWLELMTRDKP